MRAEPALSPVARIVLALAIGVVTMLVPSCGDSGAGGQAGSGGQAAGAAGAGGAVAGRGGASGAGASGNSGTSGTTGIAGNGGPGTGGAASGGSGGSGGGAAAGAAGNSGASGSSGGNGGRGGSAGNAAGNAGNSGSSGALAGRGGGAGMAGAPGGSSGGGSAGRGAVENESADCTVGALPDAAALPKITKLPDPFVKLDGTRVSSKTDWRCRRQEIRKQAEKYILGAKPMPDAVTGTVTSTKISVHVEAKGKAIDFSATVKLPTTGQAPFPALINVGTSMTLGESRILGQGVAVIYYNNYDLGKEGVAEQSRGKPNTGKYYDIYGGTDPAGLLMAWAWGASRLLDVLQASGGGMFDVSGIGVTGCSRWGKSAFTIGVFDDRIALTIPQEPSTGGDPALRIMDKLPGAERTDYNYNGLNWLSDNFAPFVFANNTSNAVKLPIDTHALIAMIAPRGLLVLENPHQTQMGAPAGHMATLAGLEVYKALGVAQNVSYHSAVADTAHCSYKNEYTDLLTASIAAFLKHTSAAPGQIKAATGSGGMVNRADWIDWTAPALP